MQVFETNLNNNYKKTFMSITGDALIKKKKIVIYRLEICSRANKPFFFFLLAEIPLRIHTKTFIIAILI